MLKPDSSHSNPNLSAHTFNASQTAFETKYITTPLDVRLRTIAEGHKSTSQFETIHPDLTKGRLKWKSVVRDNPEHLPAILPMFIADMDFPCALPIRDAIMGKAATGFLGYPYPEENLLALIRERLKQRHSLTVEPDAISFHSGLVSSLAIAGRMAESQGAAIIVPTPCYPPFVRAPENMQARTIPCGMVSNAGRWTFDYEAIESCVIAGGRYLFICNPHNPTGRVFDHGELAQIGEVAKKHNLIVVSDEVHCDLILDNGKRHISFASISEDARNRTITLLSPSKAFNVAGLNFAFAVTPNRFLRNFFLQYGADAEPHPGSLGYDACETAYTACEGWNNELRDYLRGNSQIVLETLKPYGQWLETSAPEATYLAWIDFKRTGWHNPQRTLLEKARVKVSGGDEFLASSYIRLNFGCPRRILLEGLQRIVNVLEALG